MQSNHLNDKISHEVFKVIGKSDRQNYLLFSTFAYTYGGKSYHYVGIASQVIFVGAQYDQRKNQVYKVV